MTATDEAPASRAPVMTDVARLAGVSHQTVSRVINGHPNIRPTTRQRVERAIAQLGYRPNTAARALVTRRSATVGVISTATVHWGPTSIHRTVELAAKAAGYFTSSVTLREVTRDDLRAAIAHLQDQAVEGIVMIAAQDEALEVARAQDFGVPLVVVEGDLSRGRRAVGVDQVAGARLAVRHLLELGHTHVAHVAGPVDWAEARARRDGWQQEITRAGLPLRGPQQGDWTPASGYAAGLRLAADPLTTAVFCANDHMALGLLRAVTESGRRVPENLSVVGFDDVPEAAYLLPPLTTVQQDFPAVGRRAIEVLHAAITGTGENLPRLLPATLVVRASTSTP